MVPVPALSVERCWRGSAGSAPGSAAQWSGCHHWPGCGSLRPSGRAVLEQI